MKKWKLQFRRPSDLSLACILNLTTGKQKEESDSLKMPSADNFDINLEMIVPHNSAITGHPLLEIDIPRSSLIVAVGRDGRFLLPGERIILQERDVVFLLAQEEDVPLIHGLFSRKKEKD